MTLRDTLSSIGVELRPTTLLSWDYIELLLVIKGVFGWEKNIYKGMIFQEKHFLLENEYQNKFYI